MGFVLGVMRSRSLATGPRFFWWTGTDWADSRKDAVVYDDWSVVDKVMASLEGKEPEGYHLFGTNTRE